jgi:putative ubiquitin-RnfH superfamily antitoxin RatB of RatAB toxin-antitoxin module
MSALIHVTVYEAPTARQVREVALTLSVGATVHDALIASGLGAPGLNDEAGGVGVWGRKTTLTQPLREGDRVEIWRPLQVDPKLARRERFGKQGARTAGLFAQRRPGAKPGY